MFFSLSLFLHLFLGLDYDMFFARGGDTYTLVPILEVDVVARHKRKEGGKGIYG